MTGHAVASFFSLGVHPTLPSADKLSGQVAPERLKAAEACRAIQRPVCNAVTEVIKKSFNSAPSSRMKSNRDVGIVYGWCVFCMLVDDIDLLERHFLKSVRTVFAKLEFPEGSRSITAAYATLRGEALPRLDAESPVIMEPYFTKVVQVMSHGQVE